MHECLTCSSISYFSGVILVNNFRFDMIPTVIPESEHRPNASVKVNERTTKWI